MNKAKEISALWEQIKPQIGELVGLCCEVESHAEVTADAYQRGYETAKHECEDCPKQAYTDTLRMDVYHKGLSDAWDAARKIVLSTNDGGLFDYDKRKAVFGCGNYMALKNYSAAEAIEKIRQYEQEKDRQARIEYNFDEIKDVIETTAKEYNMSLDEIAEVLKKMGEH